MTYLVRVKFNRTVGRVNPGGEVMSKRYVWTKGAMEETKDVGSRSKTQSYKGYRDHYTAHSGWDW